VGELGTLLPVNDFFLQHIPSIHGFHSVDIPLYVIGIELPDMFGRSYPLYDNFCDTTRLVGQERLLVHNSASRTLVRRSGPANLWGARSHESARSRNAKDRNRLLSFNEQRAAI
jgi:hypothetical protein